MIERNFPRGNHISLFLISRKSTDGRSSSTNIKTTSREKPINGACTEELLKLAEYSGKRVGRPRNMHKYWGYLEKHRYADFRLSELN